MDPEDARIYHKQQQTQKPAGGAFFEEQRSGPYEVGPAGKDSKGPYAESVASMSDDSVYQSKGPQRPQPPRLTSDDGRGRNASTSNSPLSSEYKENNSGLEAPKAAYSSNQRDANGRSGRSPLARQSYVRTAPGEGLEMELQTPQQSGLMREASPAPLGEPQMPASHSRSESTDSKKRKRLSKAPPSSRK